MALGAIRAKYPHSMSKRSLCILQDWEKPVSGHHKPALNQDWLVSESSILRLSNMFTSLRRLPWPTAPSCSVSSRCRNITFSVARRAVVQNSGEVEIEATQASDPQEPEEDEGEFEKEKGGINSAKMLETFLRTEGAKFKIPQKPNNWLGGQRVGGIS